jgi:hypothetical protein
VTFTIMGFFDPTVAILIFDTSERK